MSILKILNEMSADNSRLAKIAILEREKNNQLLKDVAVAALDPYINYYQKKIPDYTAGKCVPSIDLREALLALKALSTRKVTGQKAINELGWILQNCSAEDAQVIERVIGRDLKIGANESTFNKVWPGIIPTFDVMTCHKDVSGIVFPAFGQTKMDGARCHLHFDGKTATAFARSGKEFKLFGVFDKGADIMMQAGDTFDGELLFTDEKGKLLDRKTSNGIANKANKGTITEEWAARAVFVVWDIVDFTSTIPYTDRLTELNKRFRDAFQAGFKVGVNCNMRMVKNVVVNNMEEATAFYDGERALGEEGAILKNFKTLWTPNRSKDQGKMKAAEEADLVVKGYKLGKVGSKFEGLLGSLECETSDGICSVNVSGMDEDTRFSEEDLDNWLESIVTVRYNEIIKDKKTGKYSLFLPRFICRRFDKLNANSFEELK